MEEDLFSRLERRPVAKVKKQFSINVPQAEFQKPVELDVNIQDLTSQKLFDRKNFEARMNAQDTAPGIALQTQPDKEPPLDPFAASTVPGEQEPAVSVQIKPKRRKPPPLGSVTIEPGAALEPGATSKPAKVVDLKVKGKIDRRLVLKPGVKSILSR